MSAYVGDFRTGKTIRKMWNSNAIAGESITRATNGTVSVYKDGGTTQSTTGVTDTEDFDSLTGVHLAIIDTSADGTFYSAGSDFEVVLSAATIDGKTINATLFSFSLENRSALMPTTDGRKLDVSAGGEAGVDFANIGSPTTTVNLSGTTIGTVSALAANSITSSVIATDAIGAAQIAANAIGSSELAASAATEIAEAIVTPALSSFNYAAGSLGEIIEITIPAILDDTDDIGVAGAGLTAAGLSAAGVRTAVGLASANLDTQLDALPTAAEILAAILAGSIAQTDVSADSTITVAKALLAAWVQAAGDWTLSGTTLTLKNADGTTFRTFTLDSGSAPTSRT